MSKLGKLLIARDANGAMFAVGRCVTEYFNPTVLIITSAGEIVHWNAEMCSEIAVDEEVADSLVPFPRFDFPLAKIPTRGKE